MRVVIVLLYIVEVIVCLLLIGVVLLQRSKESGTGLNFGGGVGEAIFGAQVGNVLTKATIVLGSVFLLVTTILSVLIGRGSGSIMDRVRPLPPPATHQMPAAPEDAPFGGEGVEAPISDALPAAAQAEPLSDLPPPPAATGEMPAMPGDAPFGGEGVKAPISDAPPSAAPAEPPPDPAAP